MNNSLGRAFLNYCGVKSTVANRTGGKFVSESVR